MLLTNERLAEIRAQVEYGISLNECDLALAVPELLSYIDELCEKKKSMRVTYLKLRCHIEDIESENKPLRAVAEAAEKERQKMIDIWPEPLDSEDTEELGNALKAWKEHGWISKAK